MAQPNGLNPNLYGVSFGNGPSIFGGTLSSSATILSAIGGSARVKPGSIYLSTAGTSTTTVWILLGATDEWVPLTIN